MPIPPERVERGVDRFHALCVADPPLAAELRRSRAEFFPPDAPAPEARPAPEDALAERRHLEWFLFERPSEHLGGVPAEVLVGEALDPLEAETFLGSRASVFEVTSVEPGRGLWMRDLFGHGEYPVDEPAAGESVAPGDLVVARIFPVGDTLFRLSPAAATFRDAALAAALKRDAQELSASRRGPMRVAQSELERMFFGRAAVAPPDPAALRAAVRERLVGGGAEPALVDRLLDELRDAARAGHPSALTEALNLLAFDTPVELEEARQALLELWSAWTRAGASAPLARGEEGLPREAIADALARFDAGRAQGQDLEQLFRALEDDLGLEPGEEADADEAPDFPGVVAAVVAEFLWDVERQEGPDVAARFTPLLRLGEFASSIGVIENLTADHLREFAARWVLDRGLLANAEAARDLVEALGVFSRWCEETQDLHLAQRLEPTIAGLGRSLPRIVELRRRHATRALEGAVVYTFARARDGTALLVERSGEAHEVRLDAVLDGLLREGDVVEARLQPGGTTAVGACYPPELVPPASPT